MSDPSWDYHELHCKTNFSFLQAASHAEELLARADRLGYRSVAITDINSLSGVVRAHVAARNRRVDLIIGAEIVPRDTLPIVLWVTDRHGYGQLSDLITRGRRRAPKGECWLDWQDIAAHCDRLLGGVCLDSIRPDTDGLLVAERAIRGYREAFGDRLSLLAELHYTQDDHRWKEFLQTLAKKSRVPLLAAGGVLYHVPARLPLMDVITAIRHGIRVDALGELRLPNAERHLRERAQLRQLFADFPQAVERAGEIAGQCRFSLDELRYEYPEELAPQGMTPLQYLKQLTWEGACRRYPQGLPEKVRQLLNHELALIAELRYEAYFLTVWDLVRFARRRGILCQGRGSAANSAVCYCLHVTAVDPQKTDLLFERFISRERDEAPDIDVDFEHERREEVLQYIYEKYGRERAGIVAEVITYRLRSAVRDVGKALGFSLDRVDALAKQVDGYTEDTQFAEHCQAVGIDPQSESGRRLVHLVHELIGFPRHLSQHVGGMVITLGPLSRLVPVENAAMDGRTVISWDKNDLEALGILKIDCLALGMLTAIARTFQLIRQQDRQELTLATIPAEDARVYDMICRADTMGVFQIESRAQMSMLPRLRPRCYYDLVIEIALVRPGPIQGQMVHPYLRRRMGEEPVSYPNESIRQVLQKTLGVPIFQEQAMRLAVVAAGFSPGEADQLRRAMGAWRRPGVIDAFRKKLLQGMGQRGLSREFAEQVFEQLRGFGEYGFPESHAASFALLVYVSAWLKHYYPAAFAAALINSQPMGFYAPAQLVRDARQHGVIVRPIDIHASHWDCTLEPVEPGDPGPAEDATHRWALRLGLRLIRGFSLADARRIELARQAGPFGSLQEVAVRCRLSQPTMRRLSHADVFQSLGRCRREALWESLAQETHRRPQPLLQGLADKEQLPAALPQLESCEEIVADYQASGLSLKGHPISFYRAQLDEMHVVTAAQLASLRHHQIVRVAGLVLLRQRPSTAQGITFVTLEDETGTANLVIRQATWRRFYQIARRSPAWIVHGRLEIRNSVIHLLVHRLEDLKNGVRPRF